MDKYKIFLKNNQNTGTITINSLAYRKSISVLDQIAILSHLGCLKCEKFLKGVEDKLGFGACVGAQLVKQVGASGEFSITSELNAGVTKHARTDGSKVEIKSSVGISRTKYRLLEEMDDIKLSEFDDLRLFDVDYITLS